MFETYLKKSTKYLSKHPYYNAFIHILVGVGVGFLLTYPLAGIHPVRWGIALLAVAALGHLWTLQ